MYSFQRSLLRSNNIKHKKIFSGLDKSKVRNFIDLDLDRTTRGCNKKNLFRDFFKEIMHL